MALKIYEKPTATSDAAVVQYDVLEFEGVVASSIEALSTTGTADAASVTEEVTNITSTGAHTVTLADGVAGQKKVIRLVVDGGTVTLTPANFGNGTSLTMDDAGDSVVLSFDGTNWWIESNNGTAIVA